MELKLLKILISFFFFVFSLIGNKAFADNQNTLVKVFCIEHLNRTVETRLGKGDADWEQFVLRLQARKTGDVESPDEAALFECERRYGHFFEKGEFFLKGIDELRTRKEKKRDQKNNRKGASVLSEVKTQLAGFSFTVQAPALDELVSERGQRIKRYQALWNEFLGELREQLQTPQL